ncbi:hypothetical protein DMC30DRAFT_399473 [Rhodotorula diobovata]|uniref:Uncharacterized protein n=1 Tax=Rhodotorula diobovata TaxID=5288 RepID=A0A5C5FSD1_9BASI|nr:hypothetical protein DMC30DRAFT_399473 [Rhodotorula diobovata]
MCTGAQPRRRFRVLFGARSLSSLFSFTHILLLCPTLTQTPCPRPATMKFFALAAAAAALSARAALAVPFKRDSDTPGKPAFIGTLADYSKEVPVGGSINISYNTAVRACFPSSLALSPSPQLSLSSPLGPRSATSASSRVDLSPTFRTPRLTRRTRLRS